MFPDRVALSTDTGTLSVDRLQRIRPGMQASKRPSNTLRRSAGGRELEFGCA